LHRVCQVANGRLHGAFLLEEPGLASRPCLADRPAAWFGICSAFRVILSACSSFSARALPSLHKGIQSGYCTKGVQLWFRLPARPFPAGRGGRSMRT
jgi:hypothetical protein